MALGHPTGLGGTIGAAAVVTTALLAPAVAGAAVAAPVQTGRVTVVHGIPKVAVDVYVNKTRVLSDYRFGTVTKALPLPQGRYAFTLRPAGAAATSKPVLTATERVQAGSNSTVVAYLKAAGAPALSVFGNPQGRLAPGKARLVVRHTAAAPAVDVYVGTARVIRSLRNGRQAALQVNAGTVTAKVTLARKRDAVLGPSKLKLPGQTTTIVYAIGSAKDGSLRLVAQGYWSR